MPLTLQRRSSHTDDPWKVSPKLQGPACYSYQPKTLSYLQPEHQGLSLILHTKLEMSLEIISSFHSNIIHSRSRYKQLNLRVEYPDIFWHTINQTDR